MNKWIIIALLVPSVLSAGTIDINNIDKALLMAAQTNGVPYKLLKSICIVESNLKPKAINKNDGGSSSYGLCQIKLDTARSVKYRGSIHNLYNPYVNANISARYLSRQLDRYNRDWIKAVSAYNAGTYYKNLPNREYVKKVLTKAVGL